MIAVVGLGANLGDRLGTMRAAVRALGEIARVEAVSRVYATAPVGVVDQPEFLNAAARVSFDGEPEALMDALLAIEARLGRVREGGVRFGPRTIDLDLLWTDGLATKSERLELPHPRLKERAFAVVPLLEVAPEARDPRTGEAYAVPEGEIVEWGEGPIDSFPGRLLSSEKRIDRFPR